MPERTVTVSLCMIVRDEEKNLARCLESARAAVDEIIVVDTGSLDATPDIARNYGAKVISLPWAGDFAQARNESLRLAAGDWILVLDADEELPPATVRGLRELCTAPNVEAWIFTIVSPVSLTEDAPRTRHPGLRLFRNRPVYRFEGRIHEQVKPSILRADPGAVIRHTELEIMHYGYAGGRDGRRQKTRRNIAILREILAESPGDAFANYNLGTSYYVLGDLEAARRHYEAALPNLDPRAGFAPALYRNLGVCLADTGEYAAALKTADRGLAFFPDYPDLYFLKGQIFWDLGMLAQAEASFLKCVRFQRVPPEYPTTDGITGYLAYENLAECQARAGNFAQAATWLTKAIAARPTRRLLSRLCVFLREAGCTGREIADRLRESPGVGPPELARLLFDAGEYEACLEHMEREPVADPEATVIKAGCLLRLGRPAEAALAAEAVPPGSPFAAEALRRACYGMWLQNPGRDASEVIARLGVAGSPLVMACRMINGVVAGGGMQDFVTLGEEARRLALDLAADILDLGGEHLALAAARVLSGTEPDALLALGKLSLAKGRVPWAAELLDRALKLNPEDAEAHYLLGEACAALGRHDRAFRHCLSAVRLAPGNRLYAAGVLEQLAARCLKYVAGGLGLENNNADLRRVLFRLMSLRKKALHMGKEARYGKPDP